MESPWNDELESPKPKSSCGLERGMFKRSCQTRVRPLRSVKLVPASPRSNQCTNAGVKPTATTRADDKAHREHSADPATT